MGLTPSPAEVVPAAGARGDEKHWSGVAHGEAFELVLFFDATLYAEEQVSIRMRRTNEGEVISA